MNKWELVTWITLILVLGIIAGFMWITRIPKESKRAAKTSAQGKTIPKYMSSQERARRDTRRSPLTYGEVATIIDDNNELRDLVDREQEKVAVLTKALTSALHPLEVLYTLGNSFIHPRLRHWYKKIISLELEKCIEVAVEHGRAALSEDKLTDV